MPATTTNPIDEFATDHLFLLVGTNPLPNYVAARLLAKPGGTIHLLYSSNDKDANAPSTSSIADRLEALLKSQGDNRSNVPPIRIEKRGLRDSDDWEIKQAIDSICANITPASAQQRIGLNYTGGTKPMAVHTYNAIAKRYPNAIFSYLDPRQFALRVDRHGPGRERLFYPLHELELRQRTQLSLAELAGLHGYTKLLKRPAPDHDPVLLQALLDVWQDTRRHNQWLAWLRYWQNRPGSVRLPTLNAYPALGQIIHVIETLCAKLRQTPSEDCETVLARHIGEVDLRSCGKWLRSGWLEEYVLDALTHALAQSMPEGVNSNCIAGSTHFEPIPSLIARTGKPPTKQLELDASAVFGYQLFAVSVIASQKDAKETKKHLFEAYVRGRQLGGDEAHTALVCCMDDTRPFLHEITRVWDAAGKLVVFGRRDLADLSEKLGDWIAAASR